MKKIIVFTFLFASVAVSAQNIPVDDTTARPAITEAGKPTDRLVEMMMNKDGGRLVSADGKVELIIPSGALSKNTSISIQPITNTMPNGNGQAYRLEPSGIQFQKPVQLVFHYNPEESEDSAQLLMGIAMQDDKGQWYGLNKFTLDTVAKTISGNINHFSRWATFDLLKLITISVSPRLKVKKKKLVYISHVYGTTVQKNNDKGSDDLSPLSSWKPPQKGIWRVNNIIKGNPVFGTLRWGTKDESVAEFNDYTAPASVPDWNPVTISVDLVGASFIINGITIKNLKLKTKILIYDNAYEVKMVSIVEENAGSVLGTVSYADSGSFVVSLESGKAKIIEKVNKNIPDKLDYKGKCEVTFLKTGSGNINILGVNSIKVIPPASPRDNSWIEIEFKYSPTIIPLLRFKCPPVGGRGPWYTNTNEMARTMAASVMRAFPHTVKFEAKEGMVVLQEVGGLSYFKMTVEQLPDDQ